MYAAQIYNQQENNSLPSVYGIVTTGSEWKFLKLQEDKVYIDADLYYINQVNLIIGILIQMLEGKFMK